MSTVLTSAPAVEMEAAARKSPPSAPLLTRSLPLVQPFPIRREDHRTSASSDGPLALAYVAQPDIYHTLPRMDVTYTGATINYDGRAYIYPYHDDC